MKFLVAAVLAATLVLGTVAGEESVHKTRRLAKARRYKSSSTAVGKGKGGESSSKGKGSSESSSKGKGGSESSSKGKGGSESSSKGKGGESSSKGKGGESSSKGKGGESSSKGKGGESSSKSKGGSSSKSKSKSKGKGGSSSNGKPKRKGCKVEDIIGKFEFSYDYTTIDDSDGSVVIYKGEKAQLSFEEIHTDNILFMKYCFLGSYSRVGLLAPTSFGYDGKISFKMNRWTNTSKPTATTDILNDYAFLGEYDCKTEKMIVSYQSYFNGQAWTGVTYKDDHLPLQADGCRHPYP